MFQPEDNGWNGWSLALSWPLSVDGRPRMYLIDRATLAHIGEMCAVDDESGSSEWLFPAQSPHAASAGSRSKYP